MNSNIIINPLPMQVKSQFHPSMPDQTPFDGTVVDAIKSLIELIRLKERYEQLTERIQDPQLSLAQVLLTKVVQDSCHWVRNS